jgi:hypothetical protein
LAQTEIIFPEFMDVMDLDTDSARYLLSMAMTPQDFKTRIDFKEASKMASLSRQHYGHQTVMDLKKIAEKSIGVPLDGPLGQSNALVRDPDVHQGHLRRFCIAVHCQEPEPRRISPFQEDPGLCRHESEDSRVG